MCGDEIVKKVQEFKEKKKKKKNEGFGASFTIHFKREETSFVNSCG